MRETVFPALSDVGWLPAAFQMKVSSLLVTSDRVAFRPISPSSTSSFSASVSNKICP
jgi:hypothetical protein